MRSLRDKPVVPMPLVPVALLLGGGIIAGRCLPVPTGVWLTAGASALAAAVAMLVRPHTRVPAAWALAAAVAAIGACLGELACHAVPTNHISAFVPSRQSPLATVTGRITTVPRLVADVSDDPVFRAYSRPPETSFLLAVETVSTEAGPAKCRGLVKARIKQPLWHLRCGQRIRLKGRLSRPGRPGNPGQYDSRSSARRTGALMAVSAEGRPAVQVLGTGVAWPVRIVSRLRAHARQRLCADAGYEGRLLLRAMLFGQRDRALRGINNAMVRLGVAHFLSISGLHLAVLLGFVYLIMRLLQVRPRRAALYVLLFLGFYLLVAEPRVPLLRAGIMASAICLAVVFGRSASSANLLAAAAIILLTADPMELFRPGFQLSFGIVAGIIVLFRPVQGLLFSRWLTRRGLMVFRDDQRRRRWLWYNGFNFVTRTVSLSVSAYIASVPLIAYHFGLVTPLAPIMTLAMFPLVAVMLIVGYVQLVLTPLVPNLAGGLAPLLGMLADWLGWVTATLGRLPLLSVELRPVPVWTAVLVAGTIAAAACRRRLRLTRAWTCAVILAVTVVVVAGTQLPAGNDGQAELAVLDVGHGACAVLRSSSGRTLLFDAGSVNHPDPGERIVRPFFRQRRWPDPAAAFVSHANIDHYNALPALLRRHALPAVFLNGRFALRDDLDPAVTKLIQMFADNGTRVRRIHRGQQIRIDARTRVVVLWPPPIAKGYESLSMNDSSLVLRLECDGARVMIPGDIQEVTQRLLLELPRDELAADVLILPHHGGHTPVLAEFLAAVDPHVVIRSGGPRREAASRRIRALTVNRRFLATDTDGCVTVKFTNGGPRVSGFSSGLDLQ